MATFVEVSGYSQTNLDDSYFDGLLAGYDEGYTQGHGQRKGLSVNIQPSGASESQSTTPYTVDFNGSCSMSGSANMYTESNCSLTKNGTAVWSKSVDSGKYEGTISSSFTVQKGDVLVLRGWASGGTYPGRCIVSMTLTILGDYEPPTRE